MKKMRLNLWVLIVLLGACSSKVKKPEMTDVSESSVSALNTRQSVREDFLNKILKVRDAEIRRLKAESVRVRETLAHELDAAEGTFALIEFLNAEANSVGPISVYYFSKERSALQIDMLEKDLESFLEQTGPQNAKLLTAKQGSEDAFTEVYLLTPYSTRLISSKEYDLSKSHERAEFLRFKRSWSEKSQTWSCAIRLSDTVLKCR